MCWCFVVVVVCAGFFPGFFGLFVFFFNPEWFVHYMPRGTGRGEDSVDFENLSL